MGVKILSPAPLSITGQPVSEEVELNSAATFTVTAENVEGYQWQFQRAGETTWNNCSATTEGYDKNTLKPVATELRYGFKYRCEVTGDDKSVQYTNAVMMIRHAEITAEPADDVAAVGDPAEFTVTAVGAAGYQWQFQREGETTWNNCSASTEGYNTATLKPVASQLRYTFTYRCLVLRNDGLEIPSVGVKILSPAPLVITSHPVDEIVALNESATFMVSAENEAGYQWQFQRAGETTWNNCSATTEGFDTNTLKPVATEGRYNFKYRCEVTGKDKSVQYTNAVRMIRKLKINSAPTGEVSVILGSQTTLNIDAFGAVSYQWQKMEATEWVDCTAAGSDTAAFTFTVEETDLTSYRCIVTGEMDQELISESATLVKVEEFVTNNIRYYILDGSTDGAVQVKGYAEGTGTASLTIPEHPVYAEYPSTVFTVTEIGPSAFEGNTVLVSIDLPDSVAVIREKAFKNCSNLKEMN